MFITRYSAEHVSAVQAFNDRLRNLGSPFQFNQDPRAAPWHGTLNEFCSEHYLAIDDRAAVRGAYTLIFQQFSINGSSQRIAFLQIPLSEGSVDRSFVPVGGMLLKDAQRRAPLLLALGMGGLGNPLPRMLRVMRYHVREVPFFFLVLRSKAFLTNLVPLRDTLHLRIAGSIAAYTGLGTLGIAALNLARRSRSLPARALRTEEVGEFPALVNAIWQDAAPAYSFIGFRDAETLNHLYPASDPRFHRLLVDHGGRPAGWALVTDSQMQNHNYFGDMRVGAVVNCLGGDPDAVISAATDYLCDRGVDLIVSNHLHPAWCHAFDRRGYLRYRSNFLFAVTPELHGRIAADDAALERVHINRADGDGPYNL